MASVLSTRLPAPPSAQALAPLVAERYGCSTGLALTMASGGFSSTTAAMATARQFRLLCVDPTTIREAREKGVLQ